MVSQPFAPSNGASLSLSVFDTTPMTLGSAATSSGRRVRVTAGDDHAHSGIETGQAADRLPRALIGGRGHGTGVHDDQIRLFCRNQARAATRQLTLDDERVGLIDAAPEGHDGKGLGSRRSSAASAFWPISRRNCMPSNEMAEAAR